MTDNAHPARVWMYLAASTLASGVLASLRPLFTTRMATQGLELGTAASLVGGTQALSFLAAPLIGLLIDKAVGVRRAGIAGLVMMTVGAAVAALPFAASLVASLALVTFGELFARVALLVMIADCYPAGAPRRASAFLLRHVGLNFSFFGLPALTSMLFMSSTMVVPAVMCTLIGAGATVVLLMTREEDESVPPPARTGMIPLAVFTLLGLSTAAVNVLMDKFTSAALTIDPQNVGEMGARAAFQLLNPVVVVAVGVPVAIMWTSARPASVGRITVALAASAFLFCTVEAFITLIATGVENAPVGLSVAAVNGVGALVEVLAWPLSTALVSSVSPQRYRGTFLGIWAALAGLPYAIPGPGMPNAPWAFVLVVAFGATTFALAGLLFLIRRRIGEWVNSFVDVTAQ